ncbi:hypothetical protein JCM13304A_07520 [Desulfothermus okinawensis JCM 13304]
MRIINPHLDKELTKYGIDSQNMCFNCGTCSAICPLFENSFPRRFMRYIQIGAEDEILKSKMELFKCLHCGLCTSSCPRGANPGEVMLGLKRFVLEKMRRQIHV